MNTGDIVLASTKKGFIPNAIKFFTKSKFSHSFIIMGDLLGVTLCEEADAGGVEVCRFDLNYANNTNEGYEVWTVNLPQAVKDTAIQKIMNELEVNYGFLEYVWFIWRAINKLFGKDIKQQNNWAANSGYICSQLVVQYLKDLGLNQVLVGYGNGSIAPEDLAVIFSAYPNCFTKKESVRM